MNNTTIYQQLQQHYRKLQAQLSKAQTKGRSQSFQQRLLGRIQRCSMQMKHLGAGMAVIAALGWSAPMMGQTTPLDYVELVGVNSPTDSISTAQGVDLFFVDIDGDGDKDIFERVSNYIAYYTYNSSFNYYENVGGATNPKFSPITSIVLDTLEDSVHDLSFVDVDGDGDQDLFVTGEDYYATTATGVDLKYYENTGSSSVPTYTLRTGTMNPLNNAVTYINSLPLSKAPVLRTVFVDIDGDNDKDCFIIPYMVPNRQWPTANNADRILYYENISTTNIANYQRQTGNNNPLNNIATSLATDELVTRMFFWDGDSTKDVDLDLTMVATVGTSRLLASYYYENQGTTSSSNYALSTVTPLDSLDARTTNLKMFQVSAMEDLDNDGRAEILFKAFIQGVPFVRYFKETTSFVNINKIPLISSLAIFPNPSTGIIQLGRKLTGDLVLYDLQGKLVYSQRLEQAEQVDLTALTTGIYMLSIQTVEEQFIQKITITHP